MQWDVLILILLVNDVVLGAILGGIGFFIKRTIDHKFEKALTEYTDQLARQRTRDEAYFKMQSEKLPEFMKRAEQLRSEFGLLTTVNPREHAQARKDNLQHFVQYVQFYNQNSIFLGNKLRDHFERFNGLGGDLLIIFLEMGEGPIDELREQAEKQFSRLNDCFELIQRQIAKDLGAQEEKET